MDCLAVDCNSPKLKHLCQAHRNGKIRSTGQCALKASRRLSIVDELKKMKETFPQTRAAGCDNYVKLRQCVVVQQCA